MFGLTPTASSISGQETNINIDDPWHPTPKSPFVIGGTAPDASYADTFSTITKATTPDPANSVVTGQAWGHDGTPHDVTAPQDPADTAAVVPAPAPTEVAADPAPAAAAPTPAPLAKSPDGNVESNAAPRKEINPNTGAVNQDWIGYAKGGPVDKVAGPNPPGPDDGTAKMKLGEFVITADRAKTLGEDKLKALNEGRAEIVVKDAPGDEYANAWKEK